MKSKWQELACLAQEICILWFQFFGAVFASKGNPFKNIFQTDPGKLVGVAFTIIPVSICFGSS